MKQTTSIYPVFLGMRLFNSVYFCNNAFNIGLNIPFNLFVHNTKYFSQLQPIPGTFVPKVKVYVYFRVTHVNFY